MPLVDLQPPQPADDPATKSRIREVSAGGRRTSSSPCPGTETTERVNDSSARRWPATSAAPTPQRRCVWGTTSHHDVRQGGRRVAAA